MNEYLYEVWNSSESLIGWDGGPGPGADSGSSFTLFWLGSNVLKPSCCMTVVPLWWRRASDPFIS